ncbi:hypothetical protein RYZ27_08260 [Hyphomonas sp. FCG-A18]|uniref:hypothetical protein n=1 Tax=Hyphomonas sp. FCG-A18 TaxID=3080019 RepID=UPI002B285D90|nr:hypothetical protein RYZ27_08260 [Hyphomonas sp. FCG-A18]
MAGKPLKLWTRRHTLETQLRLALGQTCVQVSKAIGFAHTTVKKRAVKENLHAPLSVEVQLGLVDELRRLKAIEAFLDAETGSAQAKRAIDELKALKDQSAPEGGSSAMMSIKKIKEMSDAELDAYLESLVPGLETKAADGLEP